MSDLIFMAFVSERRAEVGASVIRTSVDDAKEAAFRETLVGTPRRKRTRSRLPHTNGRLNQLPFWGFPNLLNLQIDTRSQLRS